MEIEEVLYVPKGYGYWDITSFSIGGSFYRAVEDMPVTVVEYMPIPYKGVDVKLKTVDGRMVAFSKADLKN